MRDPARLGPTEVTAFLSQLATAERVASSTQNQALAALLFAFGSRAQVPETHRGPGAIPEAARSIGGACRTVISGAVAEDPYVRAGVGAVPRPWLEARGATLAESRRRCGNRREESAHRCCLIPAAKRQVPDRGMSSAKYTGGVRHGATSVKVWLVRPTPSSAKRAH